MNKNRNKKEPDLNREAIGQGLFFKYKRAVVEDVRTLTNDPKFTSALEKIQILLTKFGDADYIKANAV